MGKVYRKQRIEGVTVPAIIHNGQYFWLNMAVYEDGTVSCWNKTDLSDVPYQLKRGWLTPLVPEGKGLSVYGLCWLEIAKADWKFNNESYFKFIEETVRSINPEMANIYRTTEREKAKWKDHHVAFTADPTPCKLGGKFGYQLLDGDKSNILLRNNGKITLTQNSHSIHHFDASWLPRGKRMKIMMSVRYPKLTKNLLAIKSILTGKK